MTHSLNLLIHCDFKKQAKQVIKQYAKSEQPLIEKQITKALTEIKSTPFKYKCLQYVSNPCLVGIIRRKYVGGNEGHRLVYVCPHKSNLIIPVYISPERRPNLDYQKAPWEKIADSIYDDFVNKRDSKFLNWQPSPS